MNDINTLRYDADKCIGCGMCAVVCPHRVFEMNGKKAEITNKDYCMECGACQMNCPSDAITVDSGVGCAAAMILAALKGKKESSCDCDDSSSCCG